jgi:hypothetical protein
MNALQFWTKHPTMAIISWWFRAKPNPKMGCPYCKAFLQLGDQQRYETLLDHVEDPNAEDYPLRETWVCPTENCTVHKSKSFFDSYGDLYVGKQWVYEPTTGKSSAALDSWAWHAQRNLDFQDTMLHKILMFPAGGVFCWVGLHRARYREQALSGAFCQHCLKELKLKHPEKRNKIFLPAEVEVK